MIAENSKENLCDFCRNRFAFPICLTEDVEFGDGVGNDNIIDCMNYEYDDSDF